MELEVSRPSREHSSCGHAPGPIDSPGAVEETRYFEKHYNSYLYIDIAYYERWATTRLSTQNGNISQLSPSLQPVTTYQTESNL